ncbi:MAG: EamA family transporter [Bacillota bacterium]|nr:EamA family transporter [Bacillota bacterium]
MRLAKGIFKNSISLAVLQAILAAVLFGLNAPFAKLLLRDIPPLYMASFLYLGAAVGMSLIHLWTSQRKTPSKESGLAKNDRLWVILMILLDILAPYLLMLGLSQTAAASASLLINFEMVATALIALWLFKETIGRQVWLSLIIITVASVILSLDFTDLSAISFSKGSLLILSACLCWGLENNCTRNLSAKNPVQIVMIKGFGSGLGALLLALSFRIPLQLRWVPLIAAFMLGFISYGLSIYFYVHAQRWLGAARTSMYYATAPFIGVLVSFLLLNEPLGLSFAVGAVLMIFGTILAIHEKHAHRHAHEHQVHEHRHSHIDGHHQHEHDFVDSTGEHTHVHEHKPVEHEHEHRPDTHHRHPHE